MKTIANNTPVSARGSYVDWRKSPTSSHVKITYQSINQSINQGQGRFPKASRSLSKIIAVLSRVLRFYSFIF